MRIPRDLPAPMAATLARGVAIPRAQGQVITRTVTARRSASWEGSLNEPPQTRCSCSQEQNQGDKKARQPVCQDFEGIFRREGFLHEGDHLADGAFAAGADSLEMELSSQKQSASHNGFSAVLLHGAGLP